MFSLREDGLMGGMTLKQLSAADAGCVEQAGRAEWSEGCGLDRHDEGDGMESPPGLAIEYQSPSFD